MSPSRIWSRPSACWRPNRSPAPCTPGSPGSPGLSSSWTGLLGDGGDGDGDGGDGDGEDRNGDIDDALTGLLDRYPENAPYDLINGLTGLGVYVPARWPRPARQTRSRRHRPPEPPAAAP